MRWGRLGSDSLARTTVRDTATLLTGLQAHTRYEVLVSPFTGAGPGPAAARTVARTLEGVPSGPPLSVSCSPATTTTLALTWEPPGPEQRGGEIVSYLVTWRLEHKLGQAEIHSQRVAGTSATLAGLETHSNYFVKAGYTDIPGQAD